MRRVIGTLIAIAALTALPDDALAAKRNPCKPPRGATVQERTSQAVIWETSDSEGNFEIVGCARGARRATTLDSGFSCDCSVGDDTPATVELVGRYALVDVPPPGSEGPPGLNPPPGPGVITTTTVTDLKSGRDIASTGQIVDAFTPAKGGLIAVTRTSETGTVALVRITARGTESELDRGDIAIDSVAITRSGRRIYWVNAGVAKSAAVA